MTTKAKNSTQANEISTIIAQKLALWISGLTMAIVLAIGSLVIDLKANTSVINYRLSTIEKNQAKILRAITDLSNIEVKP